jgi:SAM-dependent methyltransferase
MPLVVRPPPAPEPSVILAEAFDAIADRYDDCYHDARCRAEDQLLKQRLHAFLRSAPIASVLDLGCGTGLFLRLMGWPAHRYTGIDISPRMLRRARATFPRCTFIEASMDDRLPLVDSSFHAVVSLYALSYVSAPLHVVEEIARLLKPGGRCFLVVYAPRWYPAYSHRVPTVDLVTSPAAWSCWQALTRMRMSRFRDVRLTAFSMLPTKLLPLELPLARWLPGCGRYLIIEGTRRDDVAFETIDQRAARLPNAPLQRAH